MKIFEEIFERMDRWRNLPKYGLKTRADIFFSVYLKTALETLSQRGLSNHLEHGARSQQVI